MEAAQGYQTTVKTGGVPPKSAAMAGKSKAVVEEGKHELVDINVGTPTEQLVAQIQRSYAESTRTKLSSNNWEEKLEYMDEILASLQQHATIDQPTTDTTCRMLIRSLVTKKETNVQVTKKGFAIVHLLSEKAVNTGKRSAHGMVSALVEKLGDDNLRTSASDCLLSIAQGPDLRNILSDVKPALLTGMDEAFAKAANDEPIEAAKRQVRCAADAARAGAAGGEDAIINMTAPISGHIKALGDANWKARPATITAIDEPVTKAKPLGSKRPHMEGSCDEPWAALKASLKSSNRDLATQVLVLLGKIPEAGGPSVDKYAKYVMPNMLALISDNRKTVRDAALQCLNLVC